MNRLQHLLSKLAEESGEVGKEALKAQYYGLEERYRDLPTNRERIHAELNDLMGIIKMLNDEFDLGYTPDFNHPEVTAKIERVNEFYRYSQELGLSE